MTRAKRPRDTTAVFERAAAQPPAHYVLRLYVAGSTPKSQRAIIHIKAVCEEHLQGRYELEVIDIYQRPEEVAKAQVIAAPTLLKQLPLPLRRLVGDLSDTERVLVGLNLQPGTGRRAP
jgi:circadian clock protein KaiB